MLRWMMLLMTLSLMAPLATPGASDGDGAAEPRVRGTASYHERLALPAGALFEATLADFARADAPAEPLGRVTLDGSSGPPFAFAIPYDPARIDPRGRYAVRARITLDGQLLFTSDTVHPVISGGHPDTVDIPLRQVGPPHGLRLPATFRGVLPCADCSGVRHHLDLWADNVFHLRREWLERGLVRDDLGRWRYAPARRALILTGGAEMLLQFEVVGPNELRALDLQGNPIESALDYGLRSDGTLTPTELATFFTGELRYLADAASFSECLTGRRYPVAFEADWPSAERAYLAAVAEPGGPLHTSFEGLLVERPKMDGEGTVPTLVVSRFINVWPGQSCGRDRAQTHPFGGPTPPE
jgi:copper homeostasis protein (lipoprotein)